MGGLRRFSGLLAAALSLATACASHPHVFVDGGIDFRFGTDGQLIAIEVTWLYDPFESLYMLSAHEMGLNNQGELDEADRLELTRRLSEWPEDFDGSAHLILNGSRSDLEWPQELGVHFVDGRLQLSFTRMLSRPSLLSGTSAEVAFFESTFFFDFSLTKEPKLIGNAPECVATTSKFDPDTQDRALLEVLSKLNREETSDIPNVGSYFADRITLKCD